MFNVAAVIWDMERGPGGSSTPRRWKRDRDSDNPSSQKRFRDDTPVPRSLSARAQLYERVFPQYRQPVEVGVFSLDSHRDFYNDSRQLRYYVEPENKPKFNLRDGYRDRFIKRDDGVKERLDHILRWIGANRAKLRSTHTSSSSWLEISSVYFKLSYWLILYQ